jgi:myo-inositol-1(or 4)-monophosphatase
MTLILQSNEQQLKDIESFAMGITRKAGAILLSHFQKPLDIQYKSKDGTNPVTDADKHSESFLKEAILKAFPDHAILAEEGSQVESKQSDYVWVIDPLDGTVNFLNGLPIFAVSVGVLYRGQPSVGCIFLPSATSAEGSVYHARTGSGAFRDDQPIEVVSASSPEKGRITVFPRAFAQYFRMKKGYKGKVGELRSPGSVAYEVAMTASGVVQYAVYSSPWVWDVSAGIVLVREAGGVVRFRAGRDKLGWRPFEGFVDGEGRPLGLADLKKWRTSWFFGGAGMAEFVTSHMSPKTRLEMAASRWMRRMFA